MISSNFITYPLLNSSGEGYKCHQFSLSSCKRFECASLELELLGLKKILGASQEAPFSQLPQIISEPRRSYFLIKPLFPGKLHWPTATRTACSPLFHIKEKDALGNTALVVFNIGRTHITLLGRNYRRKKKRAGRRTNVTSSLTSAVAFLSLSQGRGGQGSCSTRVPRQAPGASITEDGRRWWASGTTRADCRGREWGICLSSAGVFLKDYYLEPSSDFLATWVSGILVSG